VFACGSSVWVCFCPQSRPAVPCTSQDTSSVVSSVFDDLNPAQLCRRPRFGMATSSSPITQVSQTPIQHVGLQPHLVSRLLLDLRGQRFSVDRETIMNLPESVLLCLFPNGLVLSRNSALLDPTENEEDEEVYGVDVCRVTEASASRLAHPASYSLTHSAFTTFSSFSKSRESTSMAHKTSQMVSSNCSSSTSTLSTTPFLPSKTPCSPNRL